MKIQCEYQERKATKKNLKPLCVLLHNDQQSNQQQEEYSKYTVHQATFVTYTMPSIFSTNSRSSASKKEQLKAEIAKIERNQMKNDRLNSVNEASDSESDSDAVPSRDTKKKGTQLGKSKKESRKPRRESSSASEGNDSDAGADSDGAADSLANHFNKGVSVKPTPAAQQEAAKLRANIMERVREDPLSVRALAKVIAETRRGGNYEPPSHKAWATSFKKNAGSKGFLPQKIEKFGRSETFIKKFPEMKDTNDAQYLTMLKAVVETSRIALSLDDQNKVVDEVMIQLGVEQTHK